MRKQTAIWTTRTGERIRICDMANSHLLHTIKFLNKMYQIKHRLELLDAYAAGASLNGEMAQECFDIGIREMEENGPEFPTIYEKMLLEARLRGLSIPIDSSQ